MRVIARATALAVAATMGASVAASGAGVSARATPCPGTFRVLHNDSIGQLRLPAGDYTIGVKRMSCQSASNNLRDFLQRPDGDLPNGWRVLVQKKKFVNRAQNVAFRVFRAPTGPAQPS
jgi:hypothetical protein